LAWVASERGQVPTTSEALPGQGAGAPEAGRRQHRRTGGWS